ncbi:CPS1 [Candida pseudojiufengensis]|uniref:CPS1 n=1 Tax=Candida pseudojiufengensis TaxID=497109 RepID=UPI0022249796|nr:CPS1 [Candida pseudojiufengensis]KAI5965681.1 CPS1 [Candida pseudojiufengensis]
MIGLPLDGHDLNTKRRKWSIVGATIVLITLIIFFSTNLFNYFKIIITSIPKDDSKICPLHEKIIPESFFKDNSTVLKILNDPIYKNESIQRLSGALQIDTQIFDHQPDVKEDPKIWKKFEKFHNYLEDTFPLIYKNLKIEKVNTYGLVYTWKGNNPSLKPTLLLAHQDTVPIQKSTLDKWTYPPLSGTYNPQTDYIYGRGAADCKNLLIAILETLEILLADNFKPERSIVVAFGFDEESSGLVGAQNIGKFLEQKYGKNSFKVLLDEGLGINLDPLTDTIIASPGIGEKGYIDIQIELKTPGGHSSIPPDHTSIGIISALNVLIEKDQFKPKLGEKNPIFQYYQCLATHDYKDKIPSFFKKVILRSGFDKFSNSKLIKFISSNRLTKYLIQTSQAIDIINGGEKANALPEQTKVLINSRIEVDSNVDVVKNHFTEKVIEIAKEYDIKVNSFGKIVYNPKTNISNGEFNISSIGWLEPAPLSPTNDKVWQYISGITRFIYEDLVFPNITYPIITAPSIMTGNTDTRWYWNLTKNIYRFTPSFMGDFIGGLGIHSVDERLPFKSHLQLQAWFYEFLQGIDEKNVGE